jgi:crotonobetainyl-CoA:carnitine CoA-transferase CaiB-like acyl-CoA transferase
VTGAPGAGPMRGGAAIADITAGLFAALGIFTALIERESSGEGQWVQSNLLMSQIALMDFQAARYLVEGDVPKQVGNDHPTFMPTSAYATRDGWVNISAAGQAIWERLAHALGHPEWIGRAEFADAAARSTNRVALNAAVGDVTVTRTSAEWVELLNEAGVPTGPIYTVDQVFGDPQVQHIRAAATVPHATLGEVRVINQAVTLSRTPAAMALPTPEHGEHTDEILRELGLDGATIDGLRARGVIEGTSRGR